MVVKFSRWAFEKFRDAEDQLGTQMRAVGEVMSIGKTYKEAFQKAIRSLEIGRYGLGFAKDFHEQSLEELLSLLSYRHQRAAVHHVRGAAQGRRRSRTSTGRTHIKPWFIQQMKELVELEEEILQLQGQDAARRAADPGQEGWLRRPLPGQAAGRARERDPRSGARDLGVVEAWDSVPVSGVENAALLLLHLQRPGPRRRSATGRR